MTQCTNPTLYPVVLSSVDGECVFAEYDLSTSVDNQTWQNIHDVVQWCCPWNYFWDFQDDFTGGIGAGPRFVPNTDDPTTTNKIWISPLAAVGDENFPAGVGYLNTCAQYMEMGGGAVGTGDSSYWEAVNPENSPLFYLELGSEVRPTADPIKITMEISSVSAGPAAAGESNIFLLGINSAQTVSYEGTTAGSPTDGWGTKESTDQAGTGSKYNFKIQPAFNRTLESSLNVCAESTSAASLGQILTYDGKMWCTSGAPTGGGSTTLGGLTNVAGADSAGVGSFLTATGVGEWVAKGPGVAISTNLFLDDQVSTKPTLKVCGAHTNIAEFFAEGGTSPALKIQKTGAVESTQGVNVTGTCNLQLTNTGNLNVTGSQLTIAVGAGQTSSPFIVSDSGANQIFYIDANANLFTSGGIDVSGNRITLVGAPTTATDAANRLYVDETTSGVSGNYILKDGSVDFTGNQSMGDNKITRVVDPTTPQDAATRVYVDTLASATSSVAGIDHGGLAGLGDDDHTQYVFKSPASSNRNLVTQTASNRPPFGIKKHAAGSVDLLQILDSGDNEIVEVDKDANLTVSGAVKGRTIEATEGVSGAIVSATDLKAVTVTGIDHGGLGGLSDDDHAQYIFNAPATSNRNLITQSNSGRPPFGIKKHATGSADLVQIFDSGDNEIVDIDKDANLTVSGTITGASGTTDTVVPNNLVCFSRQFHHNAYRNGSFSDGALTRIYMDTTDNNANFVIPAGETLKILAAYGRCKSGGTAGTTTWTLGIRSWETQAHTGTNDHTLCTGTTTDTNTYLNVHKRGTIASPLATLVGNDDPVAMCFIQHDNSGGGSSSSVRHTMDIYGIFV